MVEGERTNAATADESAVIAAVALLRAAEAVGAVDSYRSPAPELEALAAAGFEFAVAGTIARWADISRPHNTTDKSSSPRPLRLLVSCDRPSSQP
jgi:hypothetical protein